MKKKSLIIFGIFIILTGSYITYYLSQNLYLINLTSSVQEMVNSKFNLHLNIDIPEKIIFDNTDNFRTDGDIYFTKDYSTKNYESDKELNLSTFDKERDCSIESYLKDILKENNISEKDYPPFEETYYWKKITEDLDTIYMIYFPFESKLYVYTDII